MYKKILLVCVTIITIQSARAQTEKGSQLLGGDFIFSSKTSNLKSLDFNTNTYGDNTKDKTTSYGIGANYSYFIADKLDIGVNVGYGNTKQVYDENYAGGVSERKSRGFNTGVYLRKYFLYDNKIGIRTGPYVSYYTSKSKAISNSAPSYYDNDSNAYAGGLGLDFVYFPIKKLGISAVLANVSYTHQTVNGYSQGTINQFGASLTNSLSLSVNYVFGN